MDGLSIVRLGLIDLERERDHRYNRSAKGRARNAPFKGGIRATLLDQPICAIDGEGKTDPDTGVHHYTQLMATWPTGRTHISGASLTSKQCLDFLLDLPEGHTVVGYGLSYDTNMWLRGLPHAEIDRLLDTGRSYWGGYKLNWIERKRFSVSKGGRSTIVYDTLANWQTTFVKALDAWHIGTQLESDYVRAMKEERGRFTQVSDDDIERYCYLECDLLRDLCSALFAAIKATPYRPRAVYGPGALAAAALEREGVKRYMCNFDPELDLLTRYAYFGGRFDVSILGWFEDVLQYDIKSAYPDQIRYLPCLKHATWRKTSYQEVTQWGMFHVDWDVDDRVPWPPFPHRTEQGLVYYPYKGEGWYHGSEVLAALEMFGRKHIRVTHGWALDVGCEHHPFAFVDALFDQRKAMEYGQGIVLKLILNSLYGKLAQQVGERKGKKPPFQCFYWAGAITAGTRAKILRALRAAPRDVIGIATDSLVSLRALELTLGSNLGEWDVKDLSEYAQISNGIYYAVERESGKAVERSRGIERSTLDWDAVKACYNATRGTGTFEFMPKSRFITLREARMHLNRRELECRWIGPGTPNPAPPRTQTFWPKRRFPTTYDPSGPRMVIEAIAPDDYGASMQSQPIRTKESWQEVHDLRARFNPYDWHNYA